MYCAVFSGPRYGATRASIASSRRATSAASVPITVLKFDESVIASTSVPSASQCRSQHVALVRELLEAAGEVRVPRVLRRDPQRHLLAAAGDPDRDAARLQRLRLHDGAVDLVVLTVEGGGARRPRLVHDLHALAEPREPLGHRREAVPVGAPLLLVPSAADAHLDASARDHVDRRGDLREVGGVAVAHARAHLAEAHARGGRRVRRHQRPRLVGRLGRTRHGHRVEVVVDPDRAPTGRRRPTARCRASSPSAPRGRCRPDRDASPGERTFRIAWVPA